MFADLGKIKYTSKSKKIAVDLNLIKEGVNFTEEFIIFKEADKFSIYDRICDHNSGKLISKNGKLFVQCIIGNLYLRLVLTRTV
jgi:hypothetical protein